MSDPLFLNLIPVECLENVIGISTNDCVCFDDGRTKEFSNSLSGYYMDDPDWGIPLSYPSKVYDCEFNNVWELCADARATGIMQMVTELGAMMTKDKFVRVANPWSGSVGVKDTNLVTVQRYHGICVTPTKWKGLTLTVKGIVVYADILDGTPCEVKVFEESKIQVDGDNTDASGFFSGVFYKGAAHCTGDAAIVPLTSPTGRRQRIFIINDQQASGQPNYQAYSTQVSTVSGSCCGGASRAQRIRSTWSGWAEFGGIQSDSYPSDLLSATCVSGKTYGVEADLGMSCGMGFLCQPLDWKNDSWARVLAELMVLYSNRVLLGFILKSDKANIYTSARSQELLELGGYLTAQIDKRMQWAVQQIPHDISDCYRCVASIRKTALLT